MQLRAVNRKLGQGLAKAISYRIFSTIITFCLAWILSGSMVLTLSLTGLDLLFKILAYYYFDHLWNRFSGFHPKPCVIWITGLSGAGKTTLANQLKSELKELEVNAVILDGDEIRNVINFTGFDEVSRKKHNLSVGYIASLFEKQGNVVIVALISPYQEVRDQIRKMCSNFVEVYISTPVEMCIQRDAKGLYKKAIAGEIRDFTGISAPYEIPERPELTIDTSSISSKNCALKVISFLKKENGSSGLQTSA